jgi:hypothetical protein
VTTTAKVVVADVDDAHGGTVGTREVTLSSISGGGGGQVAWDDVTGKPTTFTPATHSHDALYAPVVHSHDASYAAIAHNHDADYAALVHDHDAVYEPKNANIQAHVAAAHAPSDAQKNADITKAEIEAKLTGEISSHTHAASGGADPWTYARLATDKTVSSSAAVAIGLSFSPGANLSYEFVARLMVRTATATVGPRPGVTWATGLADGVVFIQQTSSATANVFANGNISAAVLAPVGGLPTTTGSWPALIEGMAVAGATPSGSINVTLATETAGTNVIAKAGSFLKYRTIQ